MTNFFYIEQKISQVYLADVSSNLMSNLIYPLRHLMVQPTLLVKLGSTGLPSITA